MEDEIMIVPSGPPDSFCRLCFSESNVELLLVPGVFPQPNQPLVDLVKRYINIRLTDQQEMPCGICSACRMMLEEFNRFRERCLRCDLVLNGAGGPCIQEPLCAETFFTDLPFLCDICDSGFFSRGYLDAHKANFHAEVTVGGAMDHYRCMHCPRIFASAGHMRLHMRSIHEPAHLNSVPTKRRKKRTVNTEQEPPIIPPLVPLIGRESQFAALETDIVTNINQAPNIEQPIVDEGKKPFECSTCFTRFHFIGSLKRHVADSHSRQVNKQEMKNAAPNKNRARAKTIPVPTIEPIPIEIQPYVLPSSADDVHQIDDVQVNEILPEIFVVDEAQEMNQAPSPLQQEPTISECLVFLERLNDNIIPPIRNYEIPLGKFFHSLQMRAQNATLVDKTVEDEIKRIYPSLSKQSKRVFYCDLCGHPCQSRMALTRHMMRHNDISFPCEDCGRIFQDKSSLDRHMPQHTCDFPHPCDECPLGFVRRGLLNKHKERYHGPNAAPLNLFYCSFCPRAFTNQQQLKNHRAVMHVSQAEEY
ncbi:zinc finger protein 107-like [Topomyia yanbarensis]|uniref:zinc finger protein 107-like n=1 Tax=Topomyia yanbarensis TaxID=2498891 RepID=UPI00273B7FEE|nr:zinc finger protein 107-like [Topomyia yanbarensis]